MYVNDQMYTVVGLSHHYGLGEQWPDEASSGPLPQR